MHLSSLVTVVYIKCLCGYLDIIRLSTGFLHFLPVSQNMIQGTSWINAVFIRNDLRHPKVQNGIPKQHMPKYTPEIQHRYPKINHDLKGDTFSKPSFWVSILVFRGVKLYIMDTTKKTWHLGLPELSTDLISALA